AALGSTPLYAQDPVTYTVSFDNAAHHEAAVTARFTGVSGGPLEVRMSRSSPGRYALMEFARNVYSFRAFDGKGNELAVTRPDPHQWDVSGHDGTVEIRYTLFGDQANGTFTGIDASHAHLNMPATFAWARGMEERPIGIEFKKPAGSGWKAATQLFPTRHPMMFTSPDLQYFMDSPTELSDYTLRTWRAGPGDTAFTFKLALHHNGTDAEADAYAAMSQRIVEETWTVFGEYPAFDNGEYVFIVDYLPWVSGDGMEHRNSTSITSAQPLRTHAPGNVGTVAHEFFHAWNVERMRPKPLEPFNFDKANMSAELWFAEGVTNYYDRLIRMRAGIFGMDRFTQSLGSTLSWFLNSPGRRYFSAQEMSQKAPLTDGAIFPDITNETNTYFSYYPFGDVIGIALDLTLRSRFPGLSLDTFMRKAWEVHGRTEVPYMNADLENVLAGLTNDPGFAREFFSKYVAGHEAAGYARLLAPAGLLLRQKDSGKASIGAVFLQYRDTCAVIGSGPPETSAMFRAGLDRGDTILTIDENKIGSKADLDSLLSKHRPGDRVDIEYIQRGKKISGSMTLGESQAYEVVTHEKAGIPLTDAEREFRRNWLGSRNPGAGPPPVKYCHECKREYPFEYEFCHYDGKELKITRE
ncbi:MAG TPA: PDZ domain-containing protein, partial [Bacteroidota bacterium]|nr:PDZ domain-containing protein [Bacteroidota bacterium]